MAVPVWVKRTGTAATLCIAAAALVGVAFDESGGESWRPDELLVGGGFLGDLPKGGMNGHQSVNNMKALVHAQAGQKKLQSSIAAGIMSGKEVSGKKAKAVAAAAAEIAKILSQPSAREIVEGKHATSTHLSSDDADSSSSSHDDGHPKLASWLKTPKDEGRFSYAHKKVMDIGMSPCSTRHDFECNEEDEASEAHGWADTPDRSAIGAGTWEKNGY